MDDAGASEYVSKSLEVARYVGKDNIVGAYGEKKKCKTLWRSRGLKAKYELTTEPGWSIIKECVFKDDGTMSRYGQERYGKYGSQEERKGKDVEGACSTISA